MAAQIEANSLSDITQLAGNPPKYPRNPTETKRPSLTLYIARVPGTRDIILTTLKPQLKNVTASDVASSLYYFHLNSEEDARIIEKEQKLMAPVAPASTPKPVPRKALPDSARSSLDIKRQSTPPLVRLNSNSSLLQRKPVPSNDTVPKLLDPTPNKPPLARRPLGPRAQLSSNSVSRKPISGAVDSTHGENQHSLSRNSSPARPEPNYPRQPEYQTQVEVKSALPAFTITVIRRDPSTASQWNIGTIIGSPTTAGDDRPHPTPQQSKRPFFDLTVHLTTPGYAPFRNSYLSSQMESMGLSPTSPMKRPANETGANKPKPNYSFDRDVRMEGLDFWKRSFGQHKRSKSDVALKPGITRARSFSGSDAAIIPETPHQLPESETSSSAKGYVFLSPWNGRCKFATSSSGRSLRCRHTLPEPVSASNRDEEDAPAQLSVVVSEIRFNLPSAAIFNSVAETIAKLNDATDNPRFSIPTFDHIRNKLTSQRSPQQFSRPNRSSYMSRFSGNDELAPPQPPRHFASSSEDEQAPRRTGATEHRSSAEQGYHDEGEQNFDLSLGQEKAGGGNRGKRAKLGKLIIHDEGFKFLDLLVAANMGVWWSVWEPDF